MRRPLPAVSLWLVLLVAPITSACTGTPAPVASPTQSASQRTPTPPSSTPPPATPTIAPTIDLPNDAPRAYGKDLRVDQVPIAELLPPGAQATSVSRLSPTQGPVPRIVVAWTRGSNPFAAEHGLVLWQAFDTGKPWRVVYAFTDGPPSDVLGVRFETGDLTGDDVTDVLSFEDSGGSGGCGVWRVVETGLGSATGIFHRATCDTQVRIASGALEIREAVFAPGDAHCCPSSFRTTTLRWDGTAWTVVARRVTKA